MKISLIHPSRGRSQKAFDTYLQWIKLASGNHEIEHTLSIDNDDPEFNEYIRLFGVYLSYPNTSVVEATNHAAQWTKGDILVYLSDDFKCPENWDELLVDTFTGNNHALNLMNEPACIKVDDCLQPFHVAVLTIPIMNRALYEKLGYFWHPDYKSMFVDEDLYWTCHNNGWLYFCPELKFEHHHPANNNPNMKAPDDETYRRSSANWDQGKEAYAKRRLLNFPLSNT